MLPPDASGLLAKYQPRLIWVLADFRHPDVTLESGVLNTFGELIPRSNLKYIFK